MRPSRRARRLALAVFLAAMAIFSALAAFSRIVFDQTEDRLLQQRRNEGIALLTVSVNDARAPLDAAAKLVGVTGGDTDSFEQVLAPYVGDGKMFSSAALFRVGVAPPVMTMGVPMSLGIDGENGSAALVADARTAPFIIVDLLQSADGRRLGYAVTDADESPAYVVYGERTLGADPHVRRRTDEAFSQLNYAIYLGTAQSDDHLLGSSTADLPMQGRVALAQAPFGNTTLLLVVTPIGHLGGWLSANLWWIAAAIGLVVSLIVATLAHHILQRRDDAERLAAENQQLYAEQREIAETLQISLLPQYLDRPPGVTITASYWPASSANLIGGDFYDVFRIDDERWGLAIGDVCGKGIEAAALTGLARHTVRAAARYAEQPSEVLRAVHVALNDHRPPTFCTACFVVARPIDDEALGLTVSLGGHPRPLLRRRDGGVEEIGVPGTLLGLIAPTLVDESVTVEPGDLLVMYTDGLTDAPADEAVGIDELIALVDERGGEPLETLAEAIRELKRMRRPQGSADDTALLIMRFGEHPGASPVTAGLVDQPQHAS